MQNSKKQTPKPPIFIGFNVPVGKSETTSNPKTKKETTSLKMNGCPACGMMSFTTFATSNPVATTKPEVDKDVKPALKK